MKTDLAEFIRDTDDGKLAESILGKCVHCGFCLATCPTYLQLGNELDSPRGRIYLMKQTLEGAEPTRTTQQHLDRCLTCRSCETTCPSGVNYAQLLEIGRRVVDDKVKRPLRDRLMRQALCFVIPKTVLVRLAMEAAWLARPLMPQVIRSKIPPRERHRKWPAVRNKRKVILHQGCVQRIAKPRINAAAAHYLDQASISAVRTNDGCCGAIGLHTGNHKNGLDMVRRNIDAWWPQIEGGAEAIVSTASGCGITIKEYGMLLRNDVKYAAKAEKVASLTVDLAEVEVDLDAKAQSKLAKRIAFHAPCTLYHGQKITGRIEQILQKSGYETTKVSNMHLCCGSAGTYSILQPEISQQLLANKLSCLTENSPEIIATANIGCLMHLQTKSDIPVKHWVELVADQQNAVD